MFRTAVTSRTVGPSPSLPSPSVRFAAVSRGLAPDSRGWLHARFSGASVSGSLGFPRCRLFSWRAVSTGTDPCFSAVACAKSRTLRGSLPLPCDARCVCRVRAGAGGCQAGFPFAYRCGIVHPSRASNAFLRVGLLPGARRCRFPAAQMLTRSIMYTSLVGFQRTPGFLCASSLASCVASRGLGRPHETRAKAHRAFDAG